MPKAKFVALAALGRLIDAMTPVSTIYLTHHSLHFLVLLNI